MFNKLVQLNLFCIEITGESFENHSGNWRITRITGVSFESNIAWESPNYLRIIRESPRIIWETIRIAGESFDNHQKSQQNDSHTRITENCSRIVKNGAPRITGQSQKSLFNHWETLENHSRIIWELLKNHELRFIQESFQNCSIVMRTMRFMRITQ